MSKNKNQRKDEAEPTHKYYRITRTSYYRGGRMYVPGEVVTIPAEEKPARDWKEVTEAEAVRAHRNDDAPVLVEADVKFGDGERPSDLTL